MSVMAMMSDNVVLVWSDGSSVESEVRLNNVNCLCNID